MSTEGTINKSPSRYELTTVYSHPQAKADIVLVHGLNGDPKKTWTAKNGIYWPTDLLPTALKTEHANVLVYGYNADVYSTRKDRSPSDNFIHQHAQSLVTSLTQHRKSRGTERNPLIWVAHSLGGILVKRALLYSNDVRAHHQEDFRSVFVSTYGIVFLGTPHNGSDIAIWGRVLQLMSDIAIPRRIFETQPTLLKALKKDNETLQAINSHFLDVYQRFRIHMVHENHRTDVRGTKILVVDAASAGPQLPGVTYYGIEASHSGMCKFEGENAPGWVNVSTAIREWVGDGGNVIPIRWEVEEDDRKARASLEMFERVRGYQSVMASSAHQQALVLSESASNAISISSQRSVIRPAMIASPSAISFIESVSSDHQQTQVPREPEPEPEPEPGGIGKPKLLTRGDDHEPLFIHPEPFRPNSFFIGREDELRGLHEMLMDRKRRSEGTSAVLIQCLPGGGKTHLARQYVFQHMADYPGGVYWVRAKSKSEMEYWFWRIAKNIHAHNRESVEHCPVEVEEDSDNDQLPLNPQKVVQTVRRWLNTQSDWLIVFDGVQFDTPGLAEFIPDARNTSMIYTSTERAVTGDPRFDNPRVMELGLLTSRQATDLLLLEMDKKLPWSADDKQNALALVQLMGRLPLMIHVAAQHLKATREPLSRYLASYRSRPKAGSLLAYKAVKDQLETRGETAALNLISLLVFFDQHVPVEMLSLGIPALDKITPVKTRDATHRKTTLNNTLMVLIAFALVERTETDEEPATPYYNSSGGDTSSHSVSTKHSFEFFKGGGARYIDLLRIHSVVQAFFIDTLHQTRQVPFWLERAAAMWCRSFDEAERRTEEDAMGLPDDYRRYAIHGEKLLGNMRRFERRYHGVELKKVRGMLEERLGRVEARVKELSAKDGGHGGGGRNSVFDRISRGGGGGSSASQSDESASCSGRGGSQNSWEAELMSPGVEEVSGMDLGVDPEEGSVATGVPPYPITPGVFGVPPYPATPGVLGPGLMPPVPIDDDEKTVVPDSASGLRVMQPAAVEQQGQYFYGWESGERVAMRPGLRRDGERVGSWRDRTVSDPRVALSQEMAIGSLSSRIPESMSPIPGKRITARSDAEMVLNKIKTKSPASPRAGVSIAAPTKLPEPEAESFTAWTAAAFQKLKETIFSLKDSSLPSRPTTQIEEDAALPLAGPTSIFRGSRSANSSPDHSPISHMRRWETNIYQNPALLRVDSSSDPMSQSFPCLPPPKRPTNPQRPNTPDLPSSYRSAPSQRTHFKMSSPLSLGPQPLRPLSYPDVSYSDNLYSPNPSFLPSSAYNSASLSPPEIPNAYSTAAPRWRGTRIARGANAGRTRRGRGRTATTAAVAAQQYYRNQQQRPSSLSPFPRKQYRVVSDTAITATTAIGPNSGYSSAGTQTPTPSRRNRARSPADYNFRVPSGAGNTYPMPGGPQQAEEGENVMPLSGGFVVGEGRPVLVEFGLQPRAGAGASGGQELIPFGGRALYGDDWLDGGGQQQRRKSAPEVGIGSKVGYGLEGASDYGEDDEQEENEDEEGVIGLGII
ncbi:hypothetical protein QBC42DRAFT_285599 [Cladorrhinum samala]|uniref:DUF676 domain-containing protein n=1 Tax=Cladorrhinum samala TaxID=585594 RepID=A0AAV9HRB0_9PEZI|nr:hypothetical protein QBC42DRAFT_285599 [Cladorrhinum samala]